MKQRGFTLVELMIVVAIVGVLAVLAVYGVRKYIANAKTAEAKNSLGQIGKDVVSAYESEHWSSTAVIADTANSDPRHALCGSATKTVPAGLNQVQGAKYQSVPADWNVDTAANAGFACLKFEMTQPQYYMYDYKAGDIYAGPWSTTAQGDLNGDGVPSTFSLVGEITSGRVKIAPAIGEVSPEE